MVKNVVIVESSTKAKTIKKYLETAFSNIDWVVIASQGHICELSKRKDGTDEYGLNNKLQPVYEIISDKKKVVKNLRDSTKNTDTVYLAADNDREGEAIAWHIKNILNLKNHKRIVFNEITMEALKHAINNPKTIDINLVDAQQSRRVMDRIIGFTMTRSIWNGFEGYNKLSAGRVQSVVLNCCVQKEQEIKRFVSSKYWTIINKFNINKIDITKLYHNDTLCKIYAKYDENTSEMKEWLGNDIKKGLIKRLVALKDDYYLIKEDITKLIHKYKDKAPDAFTTSTIQQRAYNELGFSIKKTMSVAQKLYENGHITYMRTDSTYMSNDIVKEINSYIKDKYSDRYVKENNKKSKSKHAQEAHEAIRPTRIKVKPNLDGDDKKLYELIWKRCIASRMIDTEYDELNIKLTNHMLLKNMYFLGKLSIMIEPGYKLIYGESKKDTVNLKEVYNKIENLKKIASNEVIMNCTWTIPPQRFNESSIIKFMETKGIGRPSTYVSILNKLYENMLDKVNIVSDKHIYEDVIIKDKKYEIKTEERSHEEKGKLKPTDTGIQVDELLMKYYNSIVNLKYTSDMEDKLDKIAEGSDKYDNVIAEILVVMNETKANIKKNNIILTKGKDKILKVDGKDYIVKKSIYSNIIHDVKEKRNINIEGYTKTLRKQINDITEDDIKFILKFPVKYEKYEIKLGPYGFYAINGKEKLTIYSKYIDNMRGNSYEFISEMFKKKKGKK